MKSEPIIEHRPERHYVGVRAILAMRDFDRKIGAMTTAVFEWLDSQGIPPAGKPFLRYHVIDMPDRMDVELGVPTDQALNAREQVKSHLLPGGRYAVLTYTGVTNGVRANRELVDWIREHAEQAVSHASANGEVFKARYETFLTDAHSEPDQTRWHIEVAIQLRD